MYMHKKAAYKYLGYATLFDAMTKHKTAHSALAQLDTPEGRLDSLAHLEKLAKANIRHMKKGEDVPLIDVVLLNTEGPVYDDNDVCVLSAPVTGIVWHGAIPYIELGPDHKHYNLTKVVSITDSSDPSHVLFLNNEVLSSTTKEIVRDTVKKDIEIDPIHYNAYESAQRAYMDFIFGLEAGQEYGHHIKNARLMRGAMEASLTRDAVSALESLETDGWTRKPLGVAADRQSGAELDNTAISFSSTSRKIRKIERIHENEVSALKRVSDLFVYIRDNHCIGADHHNVLLEPTDALLAALERQQRIVDGLRQIRRQL